MEYIIEFKMQGARKPVIRKYSNREAAIPVALEILHRGELEYIYMGDDVNYHLLGEDELWSDNPESLDWNN